ncbi:(d)CMP kinase [Pseudogracilibacillus sp. SE30717A]|uniref:(d)CMP kinase n=1 Tax=Pseudogracilibacillus sp. SE30717A TaxID=3098293 RepID=UPI00300E3E17
MKDRLIRIAIDGPAAAGKSTVAKKIAKQLSIVYIDTGAMYRALTLKAINQNINIEDETALYELLKKTKITLTQNGEYTTQKVFLDGTDVTDSIRSEAVSNSVSFIAKHPLIREEMVERQKHLADDVSVVMDGRDIGTHVLPHAEVKIFLIASVEERAKRRYNENIRRGIPTNLEKLKEEIKERDERDSNRTVSPLIQAKDAIAIDTTSLSIEQVTDNILGKVNEYLDSL